MICIEKLQEYYRQDRVIISIHAQERLRTASRIITAYFPSNKKFEVDMKTREEPG